MNLPSDPTDPPDVWRLDLAGEQLVVLELPHPAAGPAKLSEAEHAIVALIAKGRTNAQIAEARGTSPRTVANQVARLLERLGVGSRHELARFGAR